jgi:hypothetical protein
VNRPEVALARRLVWSACVVIVLVIALAPRLTTQSGATQVAPTTSTVPSPPATSVEGLAPTTVTYIGDSLCLDSVATWAAEAAPRFALWQVGISCSRGRGAQAAGKVLAAEGRVGEVAIIALGTNNGTDLAHWRRWIDETVKVALSRGVRTVVWVNIGQSKWGNIHRPVNELLREYDVTHGSFFEVVDWAGFIAKAA